MTALALARWTLFELGRRAGTWGCVALLAAAWPAVLVFADLGLTTRGEPISRHLYEIAFLALLIGAAFGIDTLTRGGWFLERTSPGRRLAAEAGALLGSLVLPLAAAVLPALVLAPRASGVITAGVPLALSVAHVVALSLVVLRLPWPPALRALALPLAGWALPAALAGLADSGGRVLPFLAAWSTHLLDVAHHGRLGLELPGGLAHRWGAILPITALVGAAHLLVARSPSVHALRHPR